MNTDTEQEQSTEKKALTSTSAAEAAHTDIQDTSANTSAIGEQLSEHPLINLIMRQTDYSKELAIEKLNQHNNNAIAVIREYMNPPFQEVKNNKSTSQLIYGEIRSLMGSAATNYRIRKESEERRQQMQEIAIAKAKELYEKQEAIKHEQIKQHKIKQQEIREIASKQSAEKQKHAASSLTSTL